MNLQENIHRIQSLLSENKEEMIKNMISKHGLYHSIKLMGGYDKILNTIGHEHFTNDDKIDFIRTVIENLLNKYDDDDHTTGISSDELGMSPIRLSKPEPGDNIQQIEYFNTGFVTIDIIDEDGMMIGGYKQKYTELSDEVLDKIFIFMIDTTEDIL